MSYFQHKKTVNSKFYYYIICITTCTHIALIIGLFFLYQNTDKYFKIVIERSIPTHHLNISLYTAEDKKSIKKQSPALTSTEKSLGMQTKNSSKKIPARIQKQPEKKTVAPSKLTAKPLANTKKIDVPIKKKLTESTINNNKTTKKEVPLEKKIAPVQEEQKITPVKNDAINATLEKADPTSQQSELSLNEAAFLKKINEFQEELTSVWHPPIVQKANPSCTLELYINWEGIIENIVIKETSGILIFDTAARKAVLDMHIPLWAKGKSITITLKA